MALIAALLVSTSSVVFATLYIRRSRRTRYALRNRLVPLVLIDAGPAPARPWLPMAISAVVVVMAIVVLALRSG